MDSSAVLRCVAQRSLFCFVMLLAGPLRAEDEITQTPPPTAEQLKSIQEKSLNLLRDLAPSGTSNRKMETMAIGGGMVYWGNLFDSKEVVALVDLPPEAPSGEENETISYLRECWPRYLSLYA